MAHTTTPTPIPVIRPPSKWLQYLGPAAVWAGLAVATVYVPAFNPADTKPDLSGPCLFHLTFGINEPFCGGTRGLEDPVADLRIDHVTGTEDLDQDAGVSDA